MPKDTAALTTIATLPFVQRLPDYMHLPMAKLLLDLGDPRQFEKDEVIMRQGEIGGALGYVLLEGGVTVEREGEASLQLTPPALLGEMHQFNPHAQRSATLFATVPSRALAFTWHELYERMRSIFPEEDQQLVLESLERLAEERLDQLGATQLPLFAALPEPLRLKLYLMMVWLGRPKFLEEGELLFEQATLCGNSGFFLQRGELAFTGGISGSGLIRRAPDVIGIQPSFAPDLRWSRTAKAATALEVLVFNWQDLLKRLEHRLGANDYGVLLAGLETAAQEHFAR